MFVFAPIVPAGVPGSVVGLSVALLADNVWGLSSVDSVELLLSECCLGVCAEDDDDVVSGMGGVVGVSSGVTEGAGCNH